VSQPAPEATSVPPAFEDHLRESFQQLRAALTEALASIDADPHRSRALARQLGISKSLAWRVSKIVGARNALDAVPHVPGQSALAALLGALGAAGVPESALQAVRDAMDAYDQMVAAHSGDRQTLDQLTAGMTGDGRAAERLEQGRRQAFVGLGSTWGVQARVHFSTYILGPSATDSERLDLLGMNGLVDLRRLRPDARWTLFRRRRIRSDGTALAPFRSEPLDPDTPNDDLPLVRSFCSPHLPELQAIDAGNERRYVLPAGPVGNASALSCVFGAINRSALPGHRDDVDHVQRLGCALVTPVELLQLDLIVSERLPWARNPEVVLYSQLDGSSSSLDEQDDQRLPLLETVHELGRGTSTMASPDVPGYSDMLQLAFERTGWAGETFRGYRFVMRYPPIPTTVAFVSPLPE
jgi:hypothetical protein